MSEIHLATAGFAEQRVAAFVASRARPAIRRLVLAFLRALAIWTRWIVEFARALGTAIDAPLLAWCSRDQDDLVIEIVLQRPRRDPMLSSREVTEPLTISVKRRRRSGKPAATHGWHWRSPSKWT
jgi:hypothetical protein